MAAAPAILLKGGTLLLHDDRDHVNPLRQTDILIQSNRIARIGKGLAAPAGAELVNCKGKIISPGFVDTHHHLWQTQLKGCHAEVSLFDYFVTGQISRQWACCPSDVLMQQVCPIRLLAESCLQALGYVLGAAWRRVGGNQLWDDICSGSCAWKPDERAW